MSEDGGAMDPLRRAASRWPDGTALEDGTGRWSWTELDAASDGLARGLEARGVGPGARVACLLPVGRAMVTALHGVPRTGAAVAPLHLSWTEPEREAYLRRLRPRVLLLPSPEDGAGCRIVPFADGEAGSGTLPSAENAASSRTAPPAGEDRERGPAGDHTLLATSGTSGRARIVRLTLDNHLACQRAAAERMGLGAGDRWLASLSPAHVGGVALLLRCALTGAAAVLPRRFDRERFLEEADAGRFTHASLVPTMLVRLLEARGERPAPAGLRGLLLGGDAADPERVTRALALGWPLYPTYGLTEAASQVATATPEEARRDPAAVGRPLAGVGVRIRRGEIQLRGPTLTPGYLAEAGAEPFTADGWLATGDAGRLDGEGRLTVTGRLSGRIVTGGVTVDPVEVERALRAHPAVRDACVVGVPDAEWGERVAAAVVPADPRGEEGPEKAGALRREAPGAVGAVGAPGTADAVAGLRTALEAWVEERLAPARRPRLWCILEELPRTPTGKPDRAGLRRRLEDR